jgi:hypothetical protein
LLAALAMAVGIAVGTENPRESLRQHRVFAAGLETEAVVTRLRRLKSCWVDYRFTAGGRQYDRTARIASQHWNNLEAGGPIAVRYLPSDPARSFPSLDPPYVVPLGAGIVLGALCGGLGVLALYAVWYGWCCLARGQPAPAVVTRVASRGSRGGEAAMIQYEFPLLRGGTCQGRFEVKRNPPPLGSVVCILYNPSNPRRNIRYPFALVKVAPS